MDDDDSHSTEQHLDDHHLDFSNYNAAFSQSRWSWLSCWDWFLHFFFYFSFNSSSKTHLAPNQEETLLDDLETFPSRKIEKRETLTKTPELRLSPVTEDSGENQQTEENEQVHIIPTKYTLSQESYESEEDEESYVTGGYHPVFIGSKFFNERYIVLSKLGWGHFSTVWSSKDSVRNVKVALKIVKSASHYTDAALDEIKILSKILSEDPTGVVPCIRMQDHFTVLGPNGKHVCMVFEHLGVNLLTLIRLYENSGLPMPLVKIFTKQVLTGLAFLHEKCGIIHTDLKPENILLHKTPFQIKNQIRSSSSAFDSMPVSDEDLRVCFGGSGFRCKIIDFGNACWTTEHFNEQVQTRQYRSPEVILGCDYDCSIDVWSLGCIVFELVSGDLLFQPKEGEDFYKDDDHLAQMIELLEIDANESPSFMKSGKFWNDYFDDKGELRRVKELNFWGLKQVFVEKYDMDENQVKDLYHFLLGMLKWNPKTRKSASTLMEHQWIKHVDNEDFDTAFD
eukprot:TRINITY_DN10985_c0_g1_i1.p1 TRINITY_DN10985_c0_g1~~TRINITY_DN10985_c0_g1_i1.p1  ORF type:complete len:508 (+),score=103.30 TRINITY_DN10985_c0_g1_i1:89-1612(+)